MKDLTQKELIDLLVKKLNVEYGSVEIKIHNGKCANISVTKRVNYNEMPVDEYLSKIKEG